MQYCAEAARTHGKELGMAIGPVCDKCKQELKDFGGLLFSPPDDKGMVRKLHLCQACYKELEESLATNELEGKP